MLSQVLKESKSWILTHNDADLSPESVTTLQSVEAQLLNGTPLPYVLGEWEFFQRSFKITPDVLIPRPETELLVEVAIAQATSFSAPRIVDVGTGSGIIAVTLAAELPQATVTATDISYPALQVARSNAYRHGQTRINFLQTDLLQPFKSKFNLICANLPYIPTTTLESLPDLKPEPRLALDGGDTGLSLIQTLLQQATTHLSPNGVILLEIEATLGRAAVVLSQNCFPTATITLQRDLAGLDRLVVIKLK